MSDHPSRRAVALGLGSSLLLPAHALAQADQTYSQDEILGAAQRFFGAGAEGLATVVDHVFEELGRPNAYVEGNEGSGAIGVGLRYGSGYLHQKGRSGRTRVYWQGPSIGFDTGGNASRVFTLAYHLPGASSIFTRYPGVDGSAYFIGGVGVNYQRRDGVTLAPIRAGVGFRLGANVGYLHYSRRRRINPF
ncbi:DUF1134 domain-containing protein [Candidatus Viadribacter manganicus]|uniref:DUF1134 domain-containing protein n=1 Tax=Candidatus Viadribacter manganicus TaxID=1759059 RepID=A0A1B1AG38_9PROT|nr:DUF1134 domain-containing protein [Candidatus Viadribacter manganicus]ANP45524.1 hypothetical protein ATE48_06125 [Candidatus Viadribacter manganicus]